ncbi:TonB-dependent receptor [Marivirga lumbricoides]|uniref:TonB-dependent receptor n=2 Tax=Marivirga lumbricoides TaxID=1046115 RepID=A0ABQ1MM68_9BACT|nr:TonB-dependent receptor [Marivirga lumbricoides]
MAQKVQLSGSVFSDKGKPLPGANIVTENGLGTSSNLLGNYNLNLNPGIYTLNISYIGYETISREVILEQNQNSSLNFYLTESQIELSDVVVSSNENENTEKISAIDIKLRPIQTSQDILRMVPGLFIAQHAGGGKAEQIFLRGFDIDHGTDIALSVDGMPVNMVSHAHGQGYSDLHFLIPETIEKVNFNKGPYYADQGNFNTAGFAEFKTKSFLDKSSVKLEGGQFGTIRSVAMIDLIEEKENQDLYIASEFYLTDGYFESPQNFSRLNLMAKYSGRLEDNSLVEVSASTFSSKWDASGQIPERAVESGLISRFGSIDDTEGGETSRTNLNVKYLKALDENSTLSQQVYAIDYKFNLVSNFTFFLEDPVNGDQITQSEHRKIYGYNGSYKREDRIGGLNLLSELGAGVRYDDINDIRLSKTINRREVVSDLARGDVDEYNLHAYLSETMFFSPRLSLTGSIRFDYFTFNYVDALKPNYEREQVSQGIASPKLIFNYKASNNLNLFAKGGIGFHSNDTRVVVAQQGEEILPKAYSADLGATYKPFPNLAINTALWYLYLEQEFVYVGDAGIVEPSGRTERKGIDISFRYQLLDWLYFDTDLNFTDPVALDEAEGENHIPLAPTFTSIGGLSFQLDNGLNGSLRYRYLGDRAANEDNSLTAEGYFLMDAVVNYTKPKYQVGISIENILNEEWKEAQFETESRLFNEPEPVSEIHFTPGSPFFARVNVSYFF